MRSALSCDFEFWQTRHRPLSVCQRSASSGHCLDRVQFCSGSRQSGEGVEGDLHDETHWKAIRLTVALPVNEVISFLGICLSLPPSLCIFLFCLSLLLPLLAHCCSLLGWGLRLRVFALWKLCSSSTGSKSRFSIQERPLRGGAPFEGSRRSVPFKSSFSGPFMCLRCVGSTFLPAPRDKARLE